MTGTEARLKLFIEVIGRKMSVELCSDRFFKKFGDEG